MFVGIETNILHNYKKKIFYVDIMGDFLLNRGLPRALVEVWYLLPLVIIQWILVLLTFETAHQMSFKYYEF